MQVLSQTEVSKQSAFHEVEGEPGKVRKMVPERLGDPLVTEHLVCDSSPLADVSSG